MWYNNQPRITGQLLSQNQSFYNPSTGFHKPNSVRRGQKEPNTFNGKTADWIDYIVQFEKVANWNGCDQYERAQ
jgi:hypothetical protein